MLATLRRLGLSPADAAAVESAADTVDRGLVDRYAALLRADMGGFDELPPWREGDAFVHVHAFLAVLPDVRRYHAAHRVQDDVSWATLADLGRNLATYRSVHGEAGLDEADWLTLHFRGGIYELGRLQFARSHDGALGVHIPAGAPLDPVAVEASLARARPFFDRCFPEERYNSAVCTSWLLDPQLAEVLPPDSNIVRFQRRFELLPGGWDGDSDVFKFVFRRGRPSLDELPQRTTLERALVAHLRTGGHWRVRTGRLVL